MCSESYEDWLSIYNQEIETKWYEERSELRRLTMVYCAFQNELNKLKDILNEELSSVRTALKQKDYLQKCKTFKGLAQSERFDDIITDKENETPEYVPLKERDLNETKTEDFFIESPNTAAFFKNCLPSPEVNAIPNSPVLHKPSIGVQKRKHSTSPLSLPSMPKINKTPKADETTFEDNLTPVSRDDSNIMECSIIDNTPNIKPMKKVKKPILKMKRRERSKLNKSKQANTLTQMFFEPVKVNKKIDSNLPSMSVTEMINLLNESSSSSETEAELDHSDATVDDLEIPQSDETKNNPQEENCDKVSEKPGASEFVYEEVVRGKERLKLKGWSCNECKEYYEGLDLPPEELQKKKDQCSKHRFRFKPREETFEGFWDLTFKPTQDASQSLRLNYKKS